MLGVSDMCTLHAYRSFQIFGIQNHFFVRGGLSDRLDYSSDRSVSDRLDYPLDKVSSLGPRPGIFFSENHSPRHALQMNPIHIHRFSERIFFFNRKRTHDYLLSDTSSP